MPLPPLRTLVVPQGRVTQDVLAAHLLKLHPLCKDPEAAAQPRGWGWASRGLGLPSAGLGQERAPRDPVTLKLRFVCWRQSWPRGELGEAPPKAKGQQGPRAGWTEPCGDAVGIHSFANIYKKPLFILLREKKSGVELCNVLSFVLDGIKKLRGHDTEKLV